MSPLLNLSLMDCFSGLIGLRGSLDESANTQVYLDDVGITKDLLADINYTHSDMNELLADKLDFASRTVASKVKIAKAHELKAIDLIESSRVGYMALNRDTVAAKTGYYAGSKIEISSDREYVKVYVSGISLFAQNTGNVSVLIVDLQTGQTLDTITINATSGQESYVDVDKEYKASKRNLSLGFIYDSEFTSYKTTVLEQGCSTCGGYEKSVSRYVTASGIKIADGSDYIRANTTSVADTSGLSVSYSLQCDYDQWICRNKNHLLLSVLYATGHQIAMYGLNSDRQNASTLELRNTLTNIKDFCEDNMNSQLNSALSAMIIPANNFCFKCKQKSRHVTSL